MQINTLTKPPSVASHSLHPKPQHALQGFSQPGASLPFPASSHPGPLSGDIPLIHNQQPVPLQPPRLKMPVLCHKDQFKCHFLCNSFPIHLVRINCFLLWDPSAVCIRSFLRLSLLPDSEGCSCRLLQMLTSPDAGHNLVKLPLYFQSPAQHPGPSPPPPGIFSTHLLCAWHWVCDKDMSSAFQKLVVWQLLTTNCNLGQVTLLLHAWG